MGIYDREYSSYERPPGLNLGGSRLMVTNIVLFTVGIYLLQLFTRAPVGDPSGGAVTELLSLHLDLGARPWQFYQLLTYGFVHSEKDVMHIIFNMLILWFLGRDVEAIYGGKTLLKFYLSTIFLGGVVWYLLETMLLSGQGMPLNQPRMTLLGASGGVMGVAMIFVMHYPKRVVLLFFVIPVPVWLLAVLWVGRDVFGLFQENNPVAASVHLVGVALGYLFYRTQWQLGNWLPGSFSMDALKRKPKLRVLDPFDDDTHDDRTDKLNAEVDRILEKVSREGEASLSRKERKILVDASERYQRKHRK